MPALCFRLVVLLVVVVVAACPLRPVGVPALYFRVLVVAWLVVIVAARPLRPVGVSALSLCLLVVGMLLLVVEAHLLSQGPSRLLRWLMMVPAHRLRSNREFFTKLLVTDTASAPTPPTVTAPPNATNPHLTSATANSTKTAAFTTIDITATAATASTTRA
jgi:membrane-bound ClpP family serine protease